MEIWWSIRVALDPSRNIRLPNDLYNLRSFWGVQVDIKFLQYHKFRDARRFNNLLLLPDTYVLEMILEIELLKCICFLLKRLNKAAVIITLHWGLQDLLHRDQISSLDWNWRVQLIEEVSQFLIFWA